MRATSLALVVLLISSCVIIEKEPKPMPVPVPGGSSGGVCAEEGLDILWMFRIDRETANLAEAYQSVVAAVRLGLEESGIKIRVQAAGSLYAPGLVWAEGPDLPAAPELSAVLRLQARLATSTPTTCTTQALFSTAQWLGGARVDYPAELGVTNVGSVPMATRPGALLIILVDSAARPVAPTAPDCIWEGRDPAAVIAGDPSLWVWYSDGRVLDPSRLRFVFAATPEQKQDLAAFQQACLAAGVPAAAVDSLAPSPLPFFDPVALQVEPVRPGLVTRYDLCAIAGIDGAATIVQLIREWMGVLEGESATR